MSDWRRVPALWQAGCESAYSLAGSRTNGGKHAEPGQGRPDNRAGERHTRHCCWLFRRRSSAHL